MPVDRFDELITILEAMTRPPAAASEQLGNLGPGSDQPADDDSGLAPHQTFSSAASDGKVVREQRRTTAQQIELLAGADSVVSQTGNSGEAGRLVAELELLRRATSQQTESLQGNTQALLDSIASKVAGVGEAVLKSTGSLMSNPLGSFLGISPLISGITSLFKGENDKPEPLVDFALPDPIREEMALRSDTTMSGLMYGENGLPKTTPGRNASGATQITVQVQAMDSRSFLDRSDDIARAVKDAMLHSHPLNDVVVDL